MPTPDPKRALRTHFRQQRQSLDDGRRQQEQQQIHQHLNQWVSEHKLRTIAAYWATDAEVSLNAWFPQAQQQGRQILLPVIGNTPGEMQFGIYDREDQLVPNRFGIGEPSQVMVDAAHKTELVLLPLVAFDRFGTRLGMGGGYYDRFLQRSKALRCGVGFDCQYSEAQLPRDPWDIGLHAAITGSGVLEFEHSPISNQRE